MHYDDVLTHFLHQILCGHIGTGFQEAGIDETTMNVRCNLEKVSDDKIQKLVFDWHGKTDCDDDVVDMGKTTQMDSQKNEIVKWIWLHNWKMCDLLRFWLIEKKNWMKK